MADSTMRESETLRWRTVFPWALIALVLMMGPYIVAWLARPEGRSFVGALANHNDYSSYLAAMRQGAEGRWLLRLNFSPEQWDPIFMLPGYMLIGKILGRLSHEFVAWFTFLRIAASVFTMGALVIWVREVFPGSERLQRTAWLLALFAGGLSWLIWPLTASLGVSFSYFPDISMSEWGMILISANAPHYMFGVGLEVLLFTFVIRALRDGGSLRWALASSITAVFLSLVYVYHIALAGAVVGIYLLFRLWQKRSLHWRLIGYGMIILLPLIPLLFYYAVWVNRDPLWAQYVVSEVNRIPGPPVAGLIIGLGLLGLLAIVGAYFSIRERREGLALVWLVTNLVLLYVPFVQYSGRFALGLLVPVSTMAAMGLERGLLPALRDGRFPSAVGKTTPSSMDTVRRVTILLLVPSTLMASLLLVQNPLVRSDFPNYLPVTDLEAAEWLSAHANPDDIVLSHYPIGNHLPSVSNSRVFWGQFFLTPQFEEKETLVQQFFSPSVSQAWREQFIEEWGISYIFVGTYERELAGAAFTPPGERIFANDTVEIFRSTLTKQVAR